MSFPLHQKFAAAVIAIILAIVAWQAFFPKKYVPGERQAVEGEPCKGQPIPVDYAYNWGPVEPHECKVQCSDGKERYILYSNGLATQCSKPPSCLDYGEDNRVTCVPESKSQ